MGAGLRPPLGVTAAMAARSVEDVDPRWAAFVQQEGYLLPLLLKREVLNMLLGPPRIRSQAAQCSCGASLKAGLPFCGDCGRPVSALSGDTAAARSASSRCRCGTTLRADSRFCEGCGCPASPQAPPVRRSPTCRSCGTTLRPGGRFCGGCGRRAPPFEATPPPPTPRDSLSATFTPAMPLPPPLGDSRPATATPAGAAPAVAGGGPGGPGGPGGSRAWPVSPACSPAAAMAAARLKEPCPAEPPPRAVVAAPAPPREELIQAVASTVNRQPPTRAGGSGFPSGSAHAGRPATWSPGEARGPSAPGQPEGAGLALILRVSPGQSPQPTAPESTASAVAGHAATPGPPAADAAAEGPWPSQALHDGSPPANAPGTTCGTEEPQAAKEAEVCSAESPQAAPNLGDSFDLDLAVAIARSLEDPASPPTTQGTRDP
mmetsp:Transcript_74538/g.235502  ORF Transcript_74538/g.235502 Transcript_74538/m.235502 type:complete len:432 (+) Transcript_74538:75-1370(+)